MPVLWMPPSGTFCYCPLRLLHLQPCPLLARSTAFKHNHTFIQLKTSLVLCPPLTLTFFSPLSSGTRMAHLRPFAYAVPEPGTFCSPMWLPNNCSLVTASLKKTSWTFLFLVTDLTCGFPEQLVLAFIMLYMHDLLGTLWN